MRSCQRASPVALLRSTALRQPRCPLFRVSFLFQESLTKPSIQTYGLICFFPFDGLDVQEGLQRPPHPRRPPALRSQPHPILVPAVSGLTGAGPTKKGRDSGANRSKVEVEPRERSGRAVGWATHRGSSTRCHSVSACTSSPSFHSAATSTARASGNSGYLGVQHSHSTVTAQSQHSHSTVTVQSQYLGELRVPGNTAQSQHSHRHSTPGDGGASPPQDGACLLDRAVGVARLELRDGVIGRGEGELGRQLDGLVQAGECLLELPLPDLCRRALLSTQGVY
eukprot:1195420-Prorocentrum_minimum.AAC.1